MTTSASVRAALLSAIPDLRAFAISLCGNREQGDDLVQETLLSAWAHIRDFREGSNMAAWLFREPRWMSLAMSVIIGSVPKGMDILTSGSSAGRPPITAAIFI